MCLVPERSFNRAPLDILLVYLCRFVVRVPEFSLEDFPGSVESALYGAYAPPGTLSVSFELEQRICLLLPPYDASSPVAIERVAYPPASPHRS